MSWAGAWTNNTLDRTPIWSAVWTSNIDTAGAGMGVPVQVFSVPTQCILAAGLVYKIFWGPWKWVGSTNTDLRGIFSLYLDVPGGGSFAIGEQRVEMRGPTAVTARDSAFGCEGLWGQPFTVANPVIRATIEAQVGHRLDVDLVTLPTLDITPWTPLNQLNVF